MRVRLKPLIITLLIEELSKRTIEFVSCNQINLLFLLLCVKSELEEQRGHKVLTVMPIEFDLLLLVSLQWAGPLNGPLSLEER